MIVIIALFFALIISKDALPNPRLSKVHKAQKVKCTSIDLRKTPLKHNIRNQGTTGWCYAHTAADILSYKYGKLVSATDIANTYNEVNTYSWLDPILGRKDSQKVGGHTELALKYSIDKGICLESDVRSSGVNLDMFGQYRDISIEIKKLEKYKDDFDYSTKLSFFNYPNFSLLRNSKKSKLIKEKLEEEKIEKFIGDCSSMLDRNGWKNLFPNIEIQDIIDVLKKSSETNILSQMINKSCEERRLSLKNLTIQNLKFDSTTKYLDTINSQLEKKNIIGISYFASILYKPKSKVLTGRHTSTIIGRKFNKETNSCEYLIRNSYGENCHRYSREYKCDKGNIWLPQNQVERSIFGVTYIK